METAARNPIILRTYLSLAPAKGAGVVAWLMVALATLVSWVSWADPFGWSHLVEADRAQIFQQHEFWRLFTSPWAHAGPDHLLDNFPFLFGLTFLTSAYFGLAAIPVVSLLAGAVIEALTLYFYPDGVSLVGASGVVYFLGGLWLTMAFLIERNRLSLPRRILSFAGVGLALLAPHAYEAHVSYAAHAVGFLLGPLGALALYPGLRARIVAAEVWKLPEEVHEPEPEPSSEEQISIA